MAYSNKKLPFNPTNERIKYKYRIHEKGIGQRDEKTILANLKHIKKFEEFLELQGFEKFNDIIANQYKDWLFKSALSTSFISDNLRAVRVFLTWLERQNGYRSKIKYNHIDYLNLSRNQRRQAKATLYQKVYTFEQIIKAIRLMPEESYKQKRDKALISLQALCTLRVSELRTVKLRNIIEEDGAYFVDVQPIDIECKFAKTRQVVFLPLPKDISNNVHKWINVLKELGFKPNDPLFPAVNNQFRQHNLLSPELSKEEIKSNTAIRNIFKHAFEGAGSEYKPPHSFRKTLAREAQNYGAAFLNASRQNLGHNSINTTLSSYGQLSYLDQRRIIAQVGFDYGYDCSYVEQLTRPRLAFLKVSP